MVNKRVLVFLERLILGNGANDFMVMGCWRNYTWKCECAGQEDKRKVVEGNRIVVGRNRLEVSSRKTKKCGCPVMLFVSVNE